MKIWTIIIICCMVSTAMQAQVFVTRTGSVNFFSETPLEDIKAENNQVYAAVDLSKKTIAFSMLLKSFLFRKALMQEHFNENYVESDKFPKSTFNGMFTGDVVPGKANTIRVEGVLLLHGVEKKITTHATIELKEENLTGFARFQLIPEDFKITIPGIVRDKIARQIDVQVTIDCKTVK
ncbi:MAG: YceI family protein [Chitinophagaceae bacterium]|nr:YceI family protein [Chitinophagaceae bacterium]